MVLEKVYIIPHGDEILSMPNEESKTMNKLIKENTEYDESETILIISPHSLRLGKCIPVINTKYLSGYYRIGDKILRKSYISDRVLNYAIIKNYVHTDEVNFVTNEGKLSRFPMDFGSLIPLQFFRPKKVSVLGQWRTSDKKALIDFGRCLYKITESMNEKISVVFSADQAHTHSPKGPYGFSDDARIYDQIVIDAINKNDFSKLLELSEKMIENAKPDSYWNMLSFYGFISEGLLKPVFKYHYVQEYFGMIFAYAVK